MRAAAGGDTSKPPAGKAPGRDAQVGFVTANLVAAAADYDGTEDWSRHEALTRAATDAATLEEVLETAAVLGVEGVALWTPHCWYHDPPMAPAAVRRAAADRGLEVYAYAGSLGRAPDGEKTSPAGWERTFEVAADLGCSHLAGSVEAGEREDVAACVAETGVGFAYENHPETTPGAIRERVAGYEDAFGVALDTGWAGTQGFDAPTAVRELSDLLVEVHLKDVVAAGGHDTCALGDGVVDVEGTVAALEEVGFDGWLTVEHEPYDRDPTPEVEESLRRLDAWLGE